jgi:membrane protease YdiL (CAAX protease family)
MKNGLRVLLAIGIWLAIYLLGVYVIPSIGFIDALVEKHGWLSNSEISQAVFFILSLAVIIFLPGEDRSVYGLRGVRFGRLVKPVALAVGVCLLFFILTAMVMMITGLPDEGPGGPAMNKGLLNFIVTVVIVASICEELFLRGLIQGLLSPLKEHGLNLSKVRVSWPVTICALLFGLGHLCLLGDMDPRMVTLIVISSTALGFIAGYFREKTDSLVPAIAVHMTFNIVSGVIPRLLMMAVAG